METTILGTTKYKIVLTEEQKEVFWRLETKLLTRESIYVKYNNEDFNIRHPVILLLQQEKGLKIENTEDKTEASPSSFFQQYVDGYKKGLLSAAKGEGVPKAAEKFNSSLTISYKKLYDMGVIAGFVNYLLKLILYKF